MESPKILLLLLSHHFLHPQHPRQRPIEHCGAGNRARIRVVRGRRRPGPEVTPVSTPKLFWRGFGRSRGAARRSPPPSPCSGCSGVGRACRSVVHLQVHLRCWEFLASIGETGKDTTISRNSHILRLYFMYRQSGRIGTCGGE